MVNRVTYRFFTSQDGKIDIDLCFDEETHRLVVPDGLSLPDWTRLEVQRCPNCPLGKEVARCPAAVGMAQFLASFDDHLSYDKAVVQVETSERIIVSKTSFQQGMASLLGLVLATSGCPHTRFLRPMARFHLPFANEAETIFRALAFHLLGQFVAARGKARVLSFDSLKESYAQVSIVNAALANRMRQAVKKDAALNAIIILDLFAQIAPENIDCGFDDIRPYFVVEEAP